MNKLSASLALCFIFAVPAVALAHHGGGIEPMLTLRVLAVVFGAAVVLRLAARIAAACENPKLASRSPLGRG